MTNFQSHGAKQGRRFEAMCNALLEAEGFQLSGSRNLNEIGVEIDQVATTRGGTEIWFEYKGSMHGSRPGLIRTDTLKKAIANGALIQTLPDASPYIVLASHLPDKGAGAAMLRRALASHFFADVICISDPAGVARLNHL